MRSAHPLPKSTKHRSRGPRCACQALVALVSAASRNHDKPVLHVKKRPEFGHKKFSPLPPLFKSPWPLLKHPCQPAAQSPAPQGRSVAIMMTKNEFMMMTVVKYFVCHVSLKAWSFVTRCKYSKHVSSVRSMMLANFWQPCC